MRKVITAIYCMVVCFAYTSVSKGQTNHAQHIQLLINHIVDTVNNNFLICGMCYERIKPIFNEKLFKAPPPQAANKICSGWPPANFVKDVMSDSLSALNTLICNRVQQSDYFDHNEDDEGCELELMGSKECCYCMVSGQSDVDEDPNEISIGQVVVRIHDRCKNKLTKNIESFAKRLGKDSTYPILCHKCSVKIGTCCAGCSCCCLTSAIATTASLGVICFFKPVLAGISGAMCCLGSIGGCCGCLLGKRDTFGQACAVGCCIGCCLPLIILNMALS